MTLTELTTAFERRFPVIHECRNTATPGEYFYSYVSAIIKRHSDHLDKIVYQAEVKNTVVNSVTTVDPEELRYATPEEFTNYYKRMEEHHGESNKKDSLLCLET